MRRPLIERDDAWSDFLNGLPLRPVWRKPALSPPPPRSDVGPMRICGECGNTTDGGRYCSICTDPKRDRTEIMVVPGHREIAEAEAHGYRHVYHVHAPAADGTADSAFALSRLRLQERLIRYRAVGVVLNLGDDETARGETERIREMVSGHGYWVTGLPWAGDQTPDDGSADAAFAADGAGREDVEGR